MADLLPVDSFFIRSQSGGGLLLLFNSMKCIKFYERAGLQMSLNAAESRF